jgi:glycosyltransferase involved in cell wall biosynthesis
MEIQKLVSIIVPCYNQAQYLPEALDTVLAQTYSFWECIIVNDGSPDNTEEIAKQYCEKDKRFHYVSKENGGLSSARNAGIKNSTGEFILPLDSDDLISPEYIEKATEHFHLYPDTKLVYCKAELFGLENGEWGLPEYNYADLLFENMIFCSAIYKRKDYKNTGGYNENMLHGLEDWDFWLSLIDETDIVYCLPELYFHYRIRHQSMLRSLTDESGLAFRKYIYSNHLEKYQKFIPELIWQNPQIKKQQDSILILETEIKRIKATKAFRLGKIILKPVSVLKK